MIEPKPHERIPLDQIDLFDPDRYRTGSQHPAWHTLREEAPMWQQTTPDGSRFWSATRYRDVAAILMDDKRFSSEYGTILAVAGGDTAGGKTINLMDQPRHAAVRLPTMRLMSTHLMRQRSDLVRQQVRGLFTDLLTSGGEWDIAQLALHLPMVAVGEIIGIPREVWPELPLWAMAGVAPADPHYALGTTEEETLKKAHYELFALFSELIRERRAAPRDDLMSVLIETEVEGRPMDDHMVLLNCYSFAMGAITTTPQVASHWILAMIEQPDAWQRMRQDPSLIPQAVEESLRWATPTNHLMRRTRTPANVAGVELDAGDLVCAWVASANRDGAVFDEPYRFDPGRATNPHLGFGIGPHRCIGGPPAQVVLGALMAEVIANVDTLTLAGPVQHLRSNFINGITSLPVEVGLDRAVAVR